MEIILPDEIVYELDLDKIYEDRLTLVNEIIDKYRSYFNQYWEDKKNTNGSYTHKVKTTLDILGNYLYYGDLYNESEEEYPVLSDRQMRRRSGEIEIPVNPSTEVLVGKFTEQHKKKGKIATKKYKNSITHKLTAIYISPENRKNCKIEDESKIYRHVWEIIDREIKYRCDKDKEIVIDVFTEEDMKLPYINPSLTYSWSWSYVNNDNKFIFDKQNYLVNKPYEFDKILCYKQDNNMYFLTPQIELITKYIKEI